MTSRPRVFATVVGFALGAAWLLSGACGGRSLNVPRPDGGERTGAAGGGGGGGSTGAAGTSAAGSTGAAGTSAAGSTGTAGAGAGTSGAAGTGSGTGSAGAGGQAGTTGAGAKGGQGGTTGAGAKGGQGGASMCDGPCPPTTCKVGYMSVFDPAVSCCPVCRPINCATVDCAVPPCPPGNHLETPDGQCCPVCVSGLPTACIKGRQAYANIKASITEKYTAAGCTIDADCTLVLENNLCDTDCGTAIPMALAGNYKSNLDGAAADCATCPPIALPPCAQLVALCSNGMCIAGRPPLP